MSIHFNSRSDPPYCYLSNFYGSAITGIPEFVYQSGKFSGEGILMFFKQMQTCSGEKFVEYLMALQPYKKWTDRQKCYWFRGKVPRSEDGQLLFNEAEPIRGILGKLIGGAVTSKPRQRILARISNTSFRVLPEVSNEMKLEQMMAILRVKFSEPRFRDILLSTGDAILHEKPMRGAPNAWTYKQNSDPTKCGGDWLGKLLMKLRLEIREQENSK